MKNLLSDIITAGIVLSALALTVVGVARMDSQSELDRAYRHYIDTPVVRNEWGQRRMTQEQMCSATIKQWMEICE